MQWLLLIILVPYIWIMLRIYRGLLRTRPYPPSDVTVSASIVIPCRNEQHHLKDLLSDISRQDFESGNFEVIIVDDHSTDGTYETAASFTSIKNLQAIHNRGYGKKDAIRTGVEDSHHELIITTDADCRMGTSWLKTICSFFAEYGPAMIICPVIQYGGFARRFQEIEFLALQGVTAGTALWGAPVMCNGANLAFSRTVYSRFSGDLKPGVESGDDMFLLHRMKKDKLSILWLESGQAAVNTKGADSFMRFLRQRSRWISKAGYYSDRSTITLALSVFAAVLLQAGLFLAAFPAPEVFLPPFITAFLIKSVPDYLIIRNTAERYGKKGLLKWFLPSQLVYPLYVTGVLLFPRGRWRKERISSPSPTGT
jgi:glycosyltransferase involved in cell wall biosynthesis